MNKEFIISYLEKEIKNILNQKDSSNLVEILKNDRKKILFNLNKIYNAKKILIIGDKDVDGITSTIMLKTIIKNLKGERETHTYIPSRYDGYSITFDIAKELINSEEYDLIINLDNGSSIDYFDGIINNNMQDKFLIIDHHPIGEIKNKNLSFIINPNLSGNVSTSTGLLISYIFDVLKNFEKYKNIQIFKKNLPDDYFDELRLLSALGDMVSKNSLYNRSEILKGIKKIQNSDRFLFKKIQQDDIEDIITYLNFNIIPLINSLGRLGTTEEINSFDFETLFFENKDKNKFYKEYDKLIELNQFRKELTNYFYNLAIQELNSKEKLPNVFIFYHENMPIGLNGIIAQKIYQLKGIPTICVSPHPVKPVELYGSGRGENLKNILIDFLSKNSFKINFGGHINAFGLKLNNNELNNLKQLESFNYQNKTKKDKVIEDVIINASEYKEISDYLFKISKGIPFDFNIKLLIEINDIKLIKKYNDLFALVEIDGEKGFINPEIINNIVFNDNSNNLYEINLNFSKEIVFNLEKSNKNYYNFKNKIKKA